MSADDSSANGGRDSGLRQPLLGAPESDHGSSARKAVPMSCSRCRKCPSVSLSSPKGVVLTAMALLFPLLGPVLYVTMSVNIIEAPKGIVPQGASRGSDQLACVPCGRARAGKRRARCAVWSTG